MDTDGSASSPALYFQSHPTTGFYSSAANKAGITNVGGETIDIGTSTENLTDYIVLPTNASGVKFTDVGLGFLDTSTAQIGGTTNYVQFKKTIVDTPVVIATTELTGNQQAIGYGFMNDSTTGMAGDGAGKVYLSDANDISGGYQATDPQGIHIRDEGVGFGADTAKIASTGSNMYFPSVASPKCTFDSTGFTVGGNGVIVPVGSSGTRGLGFGVVQQGFFSSGGGVSFGRSSAENVKCTSTYVKTSPSGTAAAPGFAFGTAISPTTGWFWNGTQTCQSISGVEMMQWGTGITMKGAGYTINMNKHTTTLVDFLGTGVTCNGQWGILQGDGSVLTLTFTSTITITNSFCKSTSSILMCAGGTSGTRSSDVFAWPTSISNGSFDLNVICQETLPDGDIQVYFLII